MLTTVARFDGTNGTSGTSLLLAEDGNFYGVSEGGGTYQLGTVFRLTPAGDLSAIASFDGTNGANAHGGLIQGVDGNLYGAADYGGSQNSGSVFSSTFGTIYKVTTNGNITTLHSFNKLDGAYPFAKLTLAPDGSFYGTTLQGGAYTNASGARLGTIFRVTTNGEFTLMLSFNGTNGAFPASELLEGPAGDFYGTASRGGSADQGLVFKMTTKGVLTTLASFDSTNGRSPEGGLVFHSDGFFYGTTRYGGVADGGTVFRMSTNGILTSLAALDARTGIEPRATLLPVSDSLFYGTAQQGGILPNGQPGIGSVFQVTTNGVRSQIVSFGITRGTQPLCQLCKGNDGGYYGGVFSGGGVPAIGVIRLEDAIAPSIQTVSKTNNVLTLKWNSVPGQTYGVDYLPTLDAPAWINFSSRTAVTTNTSVQDVAGASQRFYRVVLLP